MPVISRATREISCRVVYYGAAGAGKTRNLQYVFGELPAQRRGRTAALESTADRPLLFEYLPLELGSIAGFEARLHLFAVPGAPFFAATRRHVLQNADGVVFVGDSRRSVQQENVVALQQLHAELAGQNVNPRELPMVFQYNKRDLDERELLPVDELDETLNFRGVPAFGASAVTGSGVFHTLRGMAELVLRRAARGI